MNIDYRAKKMTLKPTVASETTVHEQDKPFTFLSTRTTPKYEVTTQKSQDSTTLTVNQISTAADMKTTQNTLFSEVQVTTLKSIEFPAKETKTSEAAKVPQNSFTTATKLEEETKPSVTKAPVETSVTKLSDEETPITMKVSAVGETSVITLDASTITTEISLLSTAKSSQVSSESSNKLKDKSLVTIQPAATVISSNSSERNDSAAYVAKSENNFYFDSELT